METRRAPGCSSAVAQSAGRVTSLLIVVVLASCQLRSRLLTMPIRLARGAAYFCDLSPAAYRGWNAAGSRLNELAGRL